MAESIEEFAQRVTHESDAAEIALKLRRYQRQRLNAEAKAASALVKVEQLQSQVDTLLNLGAMDEPAPIEHKASQDARREGVVVTIASDWHVEEEVRPEQVNGRNRYDLDISAERAERYFSELVAEISHRSRKHYISSLVVHFGGDMITGAIHPENVETAGLLPLEATLRAQEYLHRGLSYLREHAPVDEIRVVCNYGNHGRITHKRRHATGAGNSLEWAMYHQLARQMEGQEGLHFHIATGSHVYLPVFDWIIRAHHGDDVRYAGGVGGLSIPLHKACKQWDRFRRADLTLMGHWHSLRDYDFAIVNGSLIGYNAYALAIKASFEHPRQAVFTVDRHRGKTDFAPLYVTDEGRG